ncbi:MAG: hypothetical protein ACI4GB_05585 [Acutalibacteraceae bacterium]
MIDIKKELKEKIKSGMDSWNEPDIYAISFFVESNPAYQYRSFSNVASFAISYNTESDCPGAGDYDEERWNYAFWRQNETPIIDPSHNNELTDLLFDWYQENDIKNIGEESDCNYDEEGNYIGKGPVGHYELLTLVSDIARSLQEEGFIEEHFGKKLPIIVHGLEYAWYDLEATKNANPNKEAEVFFKACEELGFC